MKIIQLTAAAAVLLAASTASQAWWNGPGWGGNNWKMQQRLYVDVESLR
ncbi:hypothetical protein [Solemya pervernicosa gill symbiont]|nr:hypothetical protein [Solemya pervernicosa gill symbiont]